MPATPGQEFGIPTEYEYMTVRIIPLKRAVKFWSAAAVRKYGTVWFGLPGMLAFMS